MYEQVTRIGHLGRDPEMRYTPDGKPVANFSLAVNPGTDEGLAGQIRKVYHRAMLPVKEKAPMAGRLTQLP